ncbi:hypothetical protein HPP92_010967 [Vanilla planifolia]|uniref:Uncharacterized protein n=1 Tax=Vanilla planifolia TaxID=51239 RepID=A0A835QWP7_VANPL|nr:hypothetical protein HPP92_010967 [Vanilla planifolia]
MLRQNPLLKQRSWSPQSDYEESWQRRKSLYRDRRARRSLSVTDEDIEELRGFLDLGLAFGDRPPDCSDGAKRLSEALPALDLYFAVRQAYNKSTAGSNSSESASPSSSDASLVESPLSVFSISQIILGIDGLLVNLSTQYFF